MNSLGKRDAELADAVNARDAARIGADAAYAHENNARDAARAARVELAHERDAKYPDSLAAELADALSSRAAELAHTFTLNKQRAARRAARRALADELATLRATLRAARTTHATRDAADALADALTTHANRLSDELDAALANA